VMGSDADLAWSSKADNCRYGILRPLRRPLEGDDPREGPSPRRHVDDPHRDVVAGVDGDAVAELGRRRLLWASSMASGEVAVRAAHPLPPRWCAAGC
jgi:hypothetical protein